MAADPSGWGALRSSAIFLTRWGGSRFLGRTIRSEETVRGAARLAVLSYGLWQRRFGSDPDLIGEAIILDQRVIHGRRCHARGFFLCPRHRALGPDGDRPVAAVGVPGQQSRHLRGWATQPWRDHGAGSRGHGACRTSRPGGHRLDRDADGDAVARDFCRGHPAGVGRSLWRGRVRAAPRMCEHRKLTAGAR